MTKAQTYLWQLSTRKPKSGATTDQVVRANTPSQAVAYWAVVHNRRSGDHVWVGMTATIGQPLQPQTHWTRFRIDFDSETLRVTRVGLPNPEDKDFIPLPPAAN